MTYHSWVCSVVSRLFHTPPVVSDWRFVLPNRQPAITWTNADPFLGPRSQAHICDTSYCIITDHSEMYTNTGHRFISLVVLRHNIPTFELHMYSELNTNLWHMLWHTASTHIKLYKKICLEKLFSIWVCWDSTSGNNPLSVTNLLWLCLRNVQCWYSLTFDMKLPPPASHVYIWNFTMKILYHIKSSITRLDMFRKIYNQEILQC